MHIKKDKAKRAVETSEKGNMVPFSMQTKQVTAILHKDNYREQKKGVKEETVV